MARLRRQLAGERGDALIEGLFSLPLLLPAVRTSASLPLERYTPLEAAP